MFIVCAALHPLSNYREADVDCHAVSSVNKYLHPGGSHLIHQNAENTSPDRDGAGQGLCPPVVRRSPPQSAAVHWSPPQLCWNTDEATLQKVRFSTIRHQNGALQYPNFNVSSRKGRRSEDTVDREEFCCIAQQNSRQLAQTQRFKSQSCCFFIIAMFH